MYRTILESALNKVKQLLSETYSDKADVCFKTCDFISKRIATLLYDSGITSVNLLARLDLEQLQNILKSDKKKEIQSEATSVVAQTILRKAKEMLDRELLELIYTLNPDAKKITTLYKTFHDEFTQVLYQENQPSVHQSSPNIKIIDTHVLYQHVRHIKDTFVISVEIFGIHAAYVSNVESFDILDFTKWKSVFVPYKTIKNEELRLGDPKLTATVFVNTVIKAVKEVLETITIEHPVEAVLASCLFLDQQGSRITFLMYEDFCEQNELDPLANVDIMFLCNLHLEKEKFPIRITKAISHTAAHLLVGVQLTGDNTPKCLLSVHLGHTIRISYLQPNSNELGFKGEILDVEIANFNKVHFDKFSCVATHALPYTVVDFEIGASHDSKVLSRPFEAMTVTSCIHEICRRSILRIFQTRATASFWTPHIMSYDLCAEIFASSDSTELIRRHFKEMYNWELTVEEAGMVARIVESVFQRSAFLVSICIGSLAKRTGRLQSALGGVAVALTGQLGCNLYYQALLRKNLNDIFERETETLIIFLTNTDHNALGAAIFNSIKSR